MFYFFAPNTETYVLIFSHFTIVIGQLIINSNNCYVKLKTCTRKKNAKYIYHAHTLRNLINL